MSLVSALRRGMCVGPRNLRAASRSRRLCSAANPTDSESDAVTTDSGAPTSVLNASKPPYNRRPMKRFFQEYDQRFDKRLEELEAAKRVAGKNWDFVAAAFVERPQIIIGDPDPIETDYVNVREELERKYMEPFDGILAGDEEHRHSFEEARKLVQQQEDAAAAGEEIDVEKMRDTIYTKYAGSETGQRIIEQYDLLTHVDPPRKTQADHDNDRRSLNRALDHRLFLILKKNREQHAWQFPQMVHVDRDAPVVKRGKPKPKPGLRETAEEAVAHCAGPSVQGYYYSHAPQGFYYYPYDEPKSKGDSFGAKVYYYRVRYLKGQVKPVGDCVDYAWVTRDELAEYFDEDTFEFVRQMV